MDINILLTITSTVATVLLGIVVYFLKDLLGSLQDLKKSVDRLEIQVAVLDAEIKHIRSTKNG